MLLGCVVKENEYSTVTSRKIYFYAYAHF